MPAASAGAGVSIAQSRHSHPDKPSPRTVMLVLLLVSMPVGLVYFLVLRLSGWLAASFTFSMLALTFLCIAVRYTHLHPTHSPLDIFCTDHRVISSGVFHYRLYDKTRVRPRHVCATNPFGTHGPGGRAIARFMFRISIRDWFACSQPLIIMTLAEASRVLEKSLPTPYNVIHTTDPL